MRRIFLLPALALIALLPGCLVGPNYHNPDLPAPPAYAEAASTSQTQVSAADADLSHWWTQFSDPELNSLVARALAGNPDLQTAASRVRLARQQVISAVGALFPTLAGSGNVVKYDSQRNGTNGGNSGGAGGLAGIPIPSHLTLYSAGFDSTWEVDLFGGVRRAIEQAKANEEAAEWARRDGQVSLLAEVANDYLTLRALQARIAIGQAELKRQQDLFGLIQARRQNGFVTNLDVNQQSVQVATAAAQIPQLQAMAAAQVHALGVLIGQPPEALIQELAAAPSDPAAGTVPGLPPAPPSLPTGLPSQLLLRRPDLREAERRLAAANAAVGVQTANLYPKLNLIGLAAFAGPQIPSLLSSQNLSTIGVGMVSAPIFNGGRNQAAVAAAREQYNQALIAYRAAVLVAFRDVEDALARFKADDERRTQLDRAVRASLGSLQIAQDQYRTGLTPFLNVLQSENALLNSRDQLTQTDAQTLSDLVSLYKALGGGWSERG
jgi:NodT family efflux transporter outer membrane factor (OMF) lipoprotein